jgi:hypothetical protein
MKTIILLLLVAAFVRPFYAADRETPRIDGLPRVSFREAISLAQEYLRTNTIDTTGHQMSEATLGRYPGGANYWDIRWTPANKTATDDVIELRVDMDKSVNHLVHADAISLSIAVPAVTPGVERAVPVFDRNSHFHVTLSNISKEPQKIVTDGNSWGYEALTFEITDKSGRKSVARRVATDFSKNTMTWWLLQPQESVILDVYFADPQKWESFPRLERYGQSEAVTIRAIFEFARAERKPSPDGLWTGRVVSEPEELVFENRMSERK